MFTFYKKVDIANAKDQKTLLSKFGFVLRSNTCTIAYKTAARLPDLIKPEQSRLYRLFTTAVVSSIKLLPNGDSALQPIRPNLYLVKRTAPEGLDKFNFTAKWDLYRIDLQVIASGHVILTIAKDDELSFVRMFEVGRDQRALQQLTRESTAVYLAPVGRLARLSSRDVEPTIEFAEDNPGNDLDGDQAPDVWREIWKEILPPWLKENMGLFIDAKDQPWIEAEIPVQEVAGDTADPENSPMLETVDDEQVMWRPIYWPACLCFVLDRQINDRVTPTSTEDDPMQFVQDWLTGTKQQSQSAINGGRPQRDVAEDDDEPLFAEEGAFDDPEHFQPFGPPAFASSQTIYPTPPDVVMTHPTPGLSSMEGITMTPANLARAPLQPAQQHESEMQDFESMPGPGGLSGFYAEDLFEEMPDDHFGHEGNGDEPNWDFFDEPGLDNKSTPMATSTRSEAFTSKAELQEGAHDVRDSMVIDDETKRPVYEISRGEETAPASTTSRPGGIVEIQENTEQQVALPKSDVEKLSDTFRRPEPPAPGNHASDSPPGGGRSRRSSIYEGIGPLSTISGRDSKYTADGDYWFDPSPQAYQSNHLSTLTTIFQRPSSSSSDSDSSMESLYPSSAPEPAQRELAPSFPRMWTQYQPQSANTVNNVAEAKKKSAEHQIRQLLTILEPGSIEPPSISDFALRDGFHKHSAVAANKLLQIAHILVEQMSQTSLNVIDLQSNGPPEIFGDHLDVNVDLSGINTSTHASSVSQLVNLKADSNNSKSLGKVQRLPTAKICVRRADHPLFASASILGFWDTLNLQPHSGPKSVTAFCIHPNSRNVAEGCSNLLQRMTDTYNSCTLGLHSTGRISGITDDGLVVWDHKDTSRGELHQACRRFGGELATISELNGTVVVYMISENKSPASYFQACHAFYGLFESFRQALADREASFDIALQVIPQDFVASPETLVIPPQSAYLKLAIEVYNRLPPPNLSRPPAAGGTAIVLSKADNSVHFRLSPMFSSPLFKDGPCLHLAYAVSVDERWITAAWTDELGHVALTMSYCIHMRSPAHKRPRREIFREMWEVSHDIMSKVHSSWRLAVVKHGYYEPTELLEWQQIVDGSNTSRKQCPTMLLSVQLEPGFRVFPAHTPTKSGQLGVQNTYGTPASTPQASITSPDQVVAATPTPSGSSIVNVPTPSEPGFDPNTESDLTLLDPAEESWSIILPYGVNQTRSMVELRPALATGLLIKRRGSKVEDGCVAMEVSVISSSTPGTAGSAESSADGLLEDLMVQYRGLVTLAMTRGCIDPLRECIPWHIATSVKGSRILGEAL